MSPLTTDQHTTIARIQAVIRDVPDFPKPGILFKDITPVFQHPDILRLTLDAMTDMLTGVTVDVIAGIESRGFLFGVPIAERLKVPFVPIRKRGKLPAKVLQQQYDLEYGTDCIELHADALTPGQSVVIVDDLLATGGTAAAAAMLVQQTQAIVTANLFMVELNSLQGRNRLTAHSLSLIQIAD
jgi:adenine phosphoribosyltransferase